MDSYPINKMLRVLKSKRAAEMEPSGEAKRQRSELVENDDVIAEILLRLPVKFLIRFRSVCKSWQALISAPYFVNRHLRRIVTCRNKNKSKLLLPGTPLRSIDYGRLLKHLTTGDLKFDYPVMVFRNVREVLTDSNVEVEMNSWPQSIVPKCSIQIYGGCNGLVCVELDYVNIVLWNPHISESKRLSKPNICNEFRTDLYGFGYDTRSGDYKVVRGDWKDDGGCVVEVFTLKSGLWRKWCVDFVLEGQGCLVEGKLHWLQLEWEDWEDIVRAKVVSFDLAEEKFEVMVECPDPLAECEECYCSVGIGAIGGCLAVCLEPYEGDVSVWVMKEYGVKESWTEVVSIPREALPKEFNFRLRPLSISESGEVLMNLDRNVLALYNSRDKRFKAVIFTHEHVNFDTAIYAESLVSPVTGHITEPPWWQSDMDMDMDTNSSKLLLPIFPLYSVDYEALLKYMKEVDVHFATKYFDYPILMRSLSQLIPVHAASREFDCPVMVPKNSVQIYGSCNGLICLEVDYDKINLWNPCTGDSKLLPEATRFYDDQCARYYGFGYDSTTGDYKIVRGYYDVNPEAGEDEAIFEVFTVKTGMWRKDRGFLFVIGQGYLVNDALHWVQQEYDDLGYITDDSKIMSFNLREEKFQEEVSFPKPHSSSGYYESVETGAVGGFLCICFELVDSGFRIWMMKEYGVKESWTEILKISLDVLPKDCKVQLRPLCILQNGEVLLNLHGHVLALYNPERDKFRTVIWTHDDHWLNAAIYVETLVSPATGYGVGM